MQQRTSALFPPSAAPPRARAALPPTQTQEVVEAYIDGVDRLIDGGVTGKILLANVGSMKALPVSGGRTVTLVFCFWRFVSVSCPHGRIELGARQFRRGELGGRGRHEYIGLCFIWFRYIFEITQRR